MHDPAPRIIKVTYKGQRRNRTATAIVKVPYGGLYEMSEVFARMIATNEVAWVRFDVAKPKEIAAVRDSLERWLPALQATSKITGVDWQA